MEKDNKIIEKKMKKIIWITSYPKSGNTWLRSIIASLIYTSSGDFNFDLLKLIEQFDKKNRYNFLKEDNIKYSNINTQSYIKNIAKIWIKAQNKIINSNDLSPLYNIFKTHSANVSIDTNNFTSAEVTKGAIYIVRDPREIVISFSKHRGSNIDETIDYMSNPASYFPLLLIKYEDLILNAEKEISKIANFLKDRLMIKLNNLDKKINNIHKGTNIAKFREYEKKFGFVEASKNSIFFGNASINSWKKELSDNQILKIEKLFKKTMNKLGYL